MRTDLFRRVGSFRKQFLHSGDLELWMRFALQSDIGYIAGPDQVLYRDHHAGMHRANFAHALADHEQIDLAFKLLFEMAPTRSPIIAALQRGFEAAWQLGPCDWRIVHTRAKPLIGPKHWHGAYALNERSFDIRGLKMRRACDAEN